jgi:plasmid rolling circle replication initiator protein Rep
MEPGYFDHMKKTEWWVKEWQSALGCDYDPTVYIRKIRPGSDGDFNKLSRI